ncbi:glycosyltransferase family 4 protein [Actinoplanes sp. DH11]|uniref:glycosyltransferase family 4 protein n=1 Tax=Actinoplanes sp. DH11 TaxID=2857011 RepID=UPI001E4D6445|nr:glycosyltransferase family 4 protein [Actinoplanes sp. DH11]
MDEPAEKPRVLAMNCEWPATKGGIPAFNRSLVIALAEAGFPTACLVNAPTREDVEEAQAAGVTMIAAERTPAGPSMMLDSEKVRAFRPQLVIGHDRFTGPAAWVQVHRYHPEAALALIMHIAPSELERFKGAPGATARTEERERITRRIAADAQIVAAVGPRLRRYAEDLLEDGSGGRPVLQLDPGLGPTTARRRSVPPKRQVLVLGRTDDRELKGLDIAARAVATLPGPPGPPVGLLVRGAAPAECDALHRSLVGLSGLARERLDVRPFTTHQGELRRDLARALVCVMPSRVEGFGLVALDAIAAGTPLLASAKSGVAELLRNRLGRLADPMVVDIVDDPETDVRVWRAAIDRVVADPEAAFGHAEEVRRRLSTGLTWHRTATALVAAVPHGERVWCRDGCLC